MFELPKWNKSCSTMFYRHFTNFFESLHIQLFEGLLQPLLYLICFGFLLGTWFDITVVSSYKSYVYFGILCSISMSIACYETAFTTLFYSQKRDLRHYFQLLPIKRTDIIRSVFVWAVFKSLFISSVFMLIGWSLGLHSKFEFLPAIILSIVIASFFSGLTLALILLFKWNEKTYNNIIYLLIPVFLFSGTFFSVSVLPIILQELALYNPLGYSIYLMRLEDLSTWTLRDFSILASYTLAAFLLLGFCSPRFRQHQDLTS